VAPYRNTSGAIDGQSMQITAAGYQKAGAAVMIGLLAGLGAYMVYDMRQRGLPFETIHYAGLVFIAVICVLVSANFFFFFRVDDTGMVFSLFPFARYAATWDQIENCRVEPMYMNGMTVPVLIFQLKRSNRRIRVRYPALPDSVQLHQLEEMYAFAARRIERAAGDA
jgi:hypothetical protein